MATSKNLLVEVGWDLSLNSKDFVIVVRMSPACDRVSRIFPLDIESVVCLTALDHFVLW